MVRLMMLAIELNKRLRCKILLPTLNTQLYPCFSATSRISCRLDFSRPIARSSTEHGSYPLGLVCRGNDESSFDAGDGERNLSTWRLAVELLSTAQYAFNCN
jgi:hypothetical protein